MSQIISKKTLIINQLHGIFDTPMLVGVILKKYLLKKFC